MVRFNELDSAGVIRIGGRLSYYHGFSLSAEKVADNDSDGKAKTVAIKVIGDIDTVVKKEGFFYPEFKFLDQNFKVIQSLDPNIQYVDFKKNTTANQVSKEFIEGFIEIDDPTVKYILVHQNLEKTAFPVGKRMSTSMPIRVGIYTILPKPTLREEKVDLNSRGNLLFVVDYVSKG